MTFAEAARIMMSGSPVIEPLTITSNGEYIAPTGVHGYNPIKVSVPSGGEENGVWSILEDRPPLVVITLSPFVLYYVIEMGDVIGTYMSEGVHNNTRYVKYKGYKCILVGVIRIHGSPVYYHILGTSGQSAATNYEYVNDALYKVFERQFKIGAINASNIRLSKSGNTVTFNATLRWYQDCLNFSQYDYSDGSHWEETYAWASSYSPYSAQDKIYFPELPEVSYSDQIRGNTIEEKYSTWSAVCTDIFNAPSGVFPILSYTANENHFDKELYKNDDAINRGYYDSNVAYIAKWGTPKMWE